MRHLKVYLTSMLLWTAVGCSSEPPPPPEMTPDIEEAIKQEDAAIQAEESAQP